MNEVDLMPGRADSALRLLFERQKHDDLVFHFRCVHNPKGAATGGVPYFKYAGALESRKRLNLKVLPAQSRFFERMIDDFTRICRKALYGLYDIGIVDQPSVLNHPLDPHATCALTCHATRSPLQFPTNGSFR